MNAPIAIIGAVLGGLVLFDGAELATAIVANPGDFVRSAL